MGKDILNVIFGTIGSVVSWLYGGWSAVLELLMILVVLDYITGIAAASFEGKLSSSIGFKGIIRKMCIFAVVFLGHKLDIALEVDWIMNICAFFYISNELLSLLENFGRLGLPVPPQLRDAVKQLKDRGGNSNGKSA